MASLEFEIRPDRYSFRRVRDALAKEVDGRELKHDLAVNLRAAVAPGVQAVKVSALGMPSKGWAHQSMRSALAAAVDSEAILGGRRVGVRVFARHVGLRGFWHAPKRFNRKAPWEHPGPPPAWTRRIYVQVSGEPGWFDTPIRAGRASYREAAVRALRDAADRIARRSAG